MFNNNNIYKHTSKYKTKSYFALFYQFFTYNINFQHMQKIIRKLNMMSVSCIFCYLCMHYLSDLTPILY